MHKYTHVCFFQSGTQSKHSRLDMEAQVFVVVLLPSSYTLEIPSLPQVSFFLDLCSKLLRPHWATLPLCFSYPRHRVAVLQVSFVSQMAFL